MNSIKSFCTYLICILFLFNITSHAQEKKSTINFDSDGNVSSAPSYSYITYQINKKDKNQIIVSGFYISGKKLLEGIYLLKKELDLVDFNNFFKASFWLDAVKDGEYKEWYPNGNLKEQGVYVKGEKNGLYRQWYGNGNLMSKQSLINGREDGEISIFYEDGGIKMKYYALNGNITGELTEYYENGIKMKSSELKDGTMVGETRIWDQEGVEIEGE